MEEVSFKYRIRDGHVDVYIMLNHQATIVKMFDQNVWTQISDFIPQNVMQEVSGSLCFAKSLSDVRNVGDAPVFAPLLEGINLAGKLQFWSKLSQLLLTIGEQEFSYRVPPEFLAMALINGGEFNLNFASYNQVPQEVQAMITSMVPVPPADMLFDQMMTPQL